MINRGIAGLTEAEADALNRGWHRLQPLKKGFIIAPLSNGNISLMTDMARASQSESHDRGSDSNRDVLLPANCKRHRRRLDDAVQRNAP